MAAPVDERDRVYGPTRITLLPYEGTDDGVPTLHASRATSQAPNFHIVKQPDVWYPSSTTVKPNAISWDLQKQHKRWLAGTHPEAFTGMSDLLSDLMCESNDATRSANHPLLAIGQMANLTDPRRPRVRPVIAMAAGESGQLLRLCALRDSTWRWGTHQSPALHRLHLDADDADEVAHWAHDDSPILQVKAAMSLVGNEPSRYIIVQKKLATTVLKPQYRTIPVAREHSGVGEDRERPSRIDPKPVMVVSSHDTGGRPHADVSYCPGSEGKPELLAVVDDFGYWYVWEMQGRFKVTRPGLEPDLRFHGHIEQGIFDVTPTQTETTMLAATHGILWIGTSGSDWNHWDAALVAAVDSGGIPPSASSRATAFIVWSQKQLALVDLRTVTSTILDCPVRTTPKDLILDVKQNPANQRQIFVLTTTSLFWIEISPPVAAGQTASGPRILLSCAHLRSANNRFLKLKVHHGWSSLGDDASLVCLHSSRNPDIDIYAFSTHETTSLPQFQHHMVRVPGIGQGEDENGLEMQTFCLAPAILTASTPSTGPGAAHMDRDDHFWQLFVLNQDLGLKCSLVVATSSSHDDVRVPNTLKVTGKKRKIVNQRRTAFIQQLAEVFAVPDAFGEMDELFRLRQGAGGDLALIQDGPGSARRWPRSKVEGIDLLFFRVGVSMETVAMESRRVEAKGPFQGFDLIHRAVAQCLGMEDQQLPLSTLRDYQPAMEAPPIDEADEEVWDAQLHEFYGLNDQRIVIQSTAARFFGLPADANLSFSALRRHCEELWPATDASAEAQISRRLALAETVEASIRSLVGVMAFDFTSSETHDGLTSWVPEPKGPKQPSQAVSSQRTVYPTPRATASVSPGPSSHFESSQLESSQSQTSQLASQEKSVPGALQRLSMLARHVNKEAKIAGPPHPVLSYWPEERGVPMQEYQSSVLMASSQRLEAVRSRFQRIESRRQKRSRIMDGSSQAAIQDIATSSQIPRLPSSPSMPARSLVLPPAVSQQPQIAFRPLLPSSQMLSSSQLAPAMIMSQTVPGIHGRRPQGKKKAKRRGGF
ncbi:hypothetical protein VD0004_g9293 [Verticillium dahliae]|nr:Putative ATP-dependent RNA helicase prh1 [Verticillium dahliae VDG1]PNH37501.1 hypothetical protein VD0004_g9293 [Verticillium dahliae]PNH62785.1 hypothetical protein VD0001_g9349 [Verticillium dahliae]RBQ68945.1 hypothetical protein VDGD_03927 [Verticillium dahliae]